MSQIVLPYPITFEAVEAGWRTIEDRQRRGQLGWKEAGLRMAAARDPRMLLALERIVEVLDAAHEAQRGETRRQSSTVFAQRGEPIQVQVAREALVDIEDRRASATERAIFGWIYGLAGHLAGLIN